MLGGVGCVLKLLQDHCSGNAVSQLFGGADGTWHAVLARGETHLSTISLHEIPTLNAHGFGHGKDKVIALDG